jgi:hypothetical protein
MLCCLRTGHIHIRVLGVRWVKVVCQLDRWEPCCLTARCVCNWEAGISFVRPLYTYVPKRQIEALLFDNSLCYLPGRQASTTMLSVNLTYNDVSTWETDVSNVVCQLVI